jgi:hypothetical protein
VGGKIATDERLLVEFAGNGVTPNYERRRVEENMELVKLTTTKTAREATSTNTITGSPPNDWVG